MIEKYEKKIGDKLLIGRHEWCALPELNIPLIKGKVDTGAKTSAIHAFDITTKMIDGQLHAQFLVFPIQGDNEHSVACCAPVIDERDIMSSNGHKETRLIIQTKLSLGDQSWPIQVSLSNRDPLKYRLLLGREALSTRVLIDPNHTSYQKKVSKSTVINTYYQQP